MELYIKHMVSMRCKMVVEKELKNLKIHYVTIDPGVVKILRCPTPEQLEKLQVALVPFEPEYYVLKHYYSVIYVLFYNFGRKLVETIIYKASK